VWAALQEARINLEQFDRSGYEELARLIRDMIEHGAPPLTQFESRVVELKARYIFRSPIAETLRLAREALSMMTADGDVLLRMELVQTLFRLFARCGEFAEARRMFELYREFVSEVLANVDTNKAVEVAECFSLSRMLHEHSTLASQDGRALVSSPGAKEGIR